MITIKFGIPKTWINLLYKLYYPFLLSSRQIKCGCVVQHLILDNKKPIGYICTSLSKHLEIALLPQYRGKGVIERIMLKTIPRKIPKVYSFKKINYTVNLINYPSLKLLKKLNGGIYTIDKKNAYGYFYYLVDKQVPKKHRELLDRLIKLSKEKFETWSNTRFVKQYKDVKKDIEKFQSDYAAGKINLSLEDIFGCGI